LPRSLAATASSRSTIEVLLNEPVGTISPDLYGYLLENLGTVIYDGVWVGENSKIANVGGIRKELIQHLRDIKASVIRWPGGDFADYYDWHDGIGPRASRPRRTNQWSNFMPADAPSGPQRYDPEQFGTPEFMQLCRLSGGRPYLNVNTRSLRPQDFSRWVEYCNSPAGSTTLADQRKADGSLEPYGVRYWGIGNEPWAAGGDLSVEEYVTDYKRFTSEVPDYGVNLAFIACGAPPGKSTEWVSRFLSLGSKLLIPPPLFAMSIHYYATFLNDLRPEQFQNLLLAETDLSKLLPDPVRFGAFEWYDVLAKSDRMRQRIESTWQAMAEAAPKRRIKIAVDEWGCMYNTGTELNKLNLTGRAVTLRDALAAALTLDIFNGQCDKVALANFTGLINQEGGLFQADGARFVATPIYYVFRMYAGHQGGKALRVLFDVPPIHHERDGKSVSIWGLSGSASLAGHELTLTVVNPHVTELQEPSIRIRGGEVTSATVTTLTHADIHAQNTFDDPQQVRPVTSKIDVSGSTFKHRVPPASVSCLTLQLKGS
jgi:alpha-N-arabinofuranosidase